ncbi:hypothetical protein V6R21_06750 [Limibacter armeniacum]|uniref:hypothetical protein n=1 Tax=Limibacter armeniacum TaxID=466084 RepID=UPI002FE59AB5
MIKEEFNLSIIKEEGYFKVVHGRDKTDHDHKIDRKIKRVTSVVLLMDLIMISEYIYEKDLLNIFFILELSVLILSTTVIKKKLPRFIKRMFDMSLFSTSPFLEISEEKIKWRLGILNEQHEISFNNIQHIKLKKDQICITSKNDIVKKFIYKRDLNQDLLNLVIEKLLDKCKENNIPFNLIED